MRVNHFGFANISKSVFICSGWGLTENGEIPEVLLSVNLKVSAERPTGFLETLGGEEGYGVCQVTLKPFCIRAGSDSFLVSGRLWRSSDLPARTSTYSHWNFQ